jgi:DNA-binding transcriptional LysR family regulator
LALQSVDLFDDPWVLVLASESPLADQSKPLTAADVGRLPLIGFAHCRQEPWVESYMRADGADPRWVFRSEENTTIQALAAAGVGPALVPRLTVDTSDPRTTRTPLTDVFPARRLAIVSHTGRGRSVAAHAFGDLVREAAAGYAASGRATAVRNGH